MSARLVPAVFALAAAFPLQAQNALTPEQKEEVRREVRRIVAQERDSIREEIRAELAAGNSDDARQNASRDGTSPPADAAREGGGDAVFDPRAIATELGTAAATAPVDRDFQGSGVGTTTDFQLEFDKDKAVAAFLWARFSDPADAGGAIDKAISSVTRIRIWTPIDDSRNGFATFANLNGLSSGLGLKVSRSWRVTDVGFLQDLHRNATFRALCKRSGQDPDEGCDADTIYAVADNDRVMMADLQRFLREERGVQWQYSLSASAARSELEFLSPSLGKESDSKIGWGLSAGAAAAPSGRKQLYAFGAEYLREYKVPKAGIYCPPSNGSDPTRCVQGALGVPVQVTKKLLWGSLRGELAGVGYDLRITRDLVSHENAVDLPIYLLRNQKGLFSAGVRLGWTESEDFKAAIFISTPLTFP
jgi:hypothetical protein